MPTMGIYAIRNKVNGKQYIGSSTDIEQRFRSHIAKMGQSVTTSGNRALYMDWHTFGAQSFECVVLETVTDVGALEEAESRHIAEAGDSVYNHYPVYRTSWMNRDTGIRSGKLSTLQAGDALPVTTRRRAAVPRLRSLRMKRTMRALREDARMSRAEVGKAIGASAQSVYYWETDQRMPGADQLARFAALVGVCMDDVQLPNMPPRKPYTRKATPDA